MKILYVDDDAGLRRLVERGLTREGIAVDVAADGASCLTKLVDEKYDLIALDHYMPGMDGLETLAHIQKLADPPPVIVVTGAQESRIAVAALKAGAADYVIKDVQNEFIPLFKAAVVSAVGSWQMRRAKEAAEAEVRAARDRFEALANERALLLREVDHRVANSLQLIAAFLQLQGTNARSDDVKEALADATRRVMAVGQVHKKLYTSPDVQSVSADQYLSALVEDIARSSEDTATASVSLSADPIMVEPDHAVALGVIVNELVLNAMKYAYPKKKGQIRVDLKQSAPLRAVLSVEDDGVGHDVSALPVSTGLGRRIVGSMAVRLGTKVAYDEAHSGTRVVVAFDLRPPTAAPATAPSVSMG